MATIGLLGELERHGWTVTRRGSPEDVDSVQTELHEWQEIGDIDVDPAATFAPHLPVSRLTTESEVLGASYRLDRSLHEASLTGGLFDDLIDVAVELAGNAREHGSNCYAVAQTHTGRISGTPGLRLAVADFGVGFAQTLERYGQMTDSQAIVRAFEEQVSGTGNKRRGFGLSQIAGVVDMAPNNVLDIVSWTGHVRLSGGQFQSGQRGSTLPGNSRVGVCALPPPIIGPESATA